ncbi:MAG: hypothetical protein R3Y10_12635 [Ferrimonas sp.]
MWRNTVVFPRRQLRLATVTVAANGAAEHEVELFFRISGFQDAGTANGRIEQQSETLSVQVNPLERE